MNQKVFPLFSEKECREFTGLNSPVNPSGPYTFYIGRLLIIHSMPSTDIGLSDCFFLPMSHSYFCFPGDSVSKEFAWRAGDLGSIPGLGRSPGEGTATHSSILAWRIPWAEELRGYSPRGGKESDSTEQLSTAQH